MHGVTAVPIELDNPEHCEAFVRLNEQWIKEHFSLEESDQALAADPYRIVRDGGHILSLVEGGRVVGVCALFREDARRWQLARMAVDPRERGKGYGDALIVAALRQARADGATSVYLLSNTALKPAIALYRKHGFVTRSDGPHPVYSRCNVVMELRLADSALMPQRASPAVVAEETVDVFFYGLFMDEELLVGKGITPRRPRRAVAEGFALKIGKRATLVPAAGERAYGMLYALTPPELDRLYAQPGLEGYRSEPLLVRTFEGPQVTASCYNLAAAPAPADVDPSYAARLCEVLTRLEFPQEYVRSIEGLAGG